MPVGFAQTRQLSLEESILLSKENSAMIREIENKAYDIDRKIKGNLQLANKVTSALESYYDFKHAYEDAQNPQHPLHKYIGRSKERLEVDLEILDDQYTMLMAYGMESTADSVLDVMAFINAYILIGDDAVLTKEAKYETFMKNEALLKNSVALIETKYTQGLSAAERGTEAGVIKLYVGLSDLGKGLDVKRSLLAVYEEGLKDMKGSYDKGLVAKSTYDNQSRTVEMMALEIENMQYQYDNLMYQLKLMCEIPLTETVHQSTVFDNLEEELKMPSEYYALAYESNMDYKNLTAELTFNEKNFEVMNKYLVDFDEETDAPIYYQEKVDMKDLIEDLNAQIDNKKQLIECNIQDAYNDIFTKKKLVNNNKTALELAEDQLNATIQSYKLGLKTKLELNQVKLNYENVKYTADTNIRAYNTSIERFKLLINYGVAYEM